MIYDNLGHAALYRSLGPRLALGLDYLGEGKDESIEGSSHKTYLGEDAGRVHRRRG